MRSLLLVVLGACFPTVHAEDVVKTNAIAETNCATIEVTRGPGGIYVARGCGKTVAYACDRPAATGTNHSDPGCKKVDPPSEDTPTRAR